MGCQALVNLAKQPLKIPKIHPFRTMLKLTLKLRFFDIEDIEIFKKPFEAL